MGRTCACALMRFVMANVEAFKCSISQLHLESCHFLHSVHQCNLALHPRNCEKLSVGSAGCNVQLYRSWVN